MAEFTANRDEATPDELWLVEHEPVYTLGYAGDPTHIIDAGDIPVIRTDRGGQVTYHGPGQLVAYPLLDLRRLRIGIKSLVQSLEQILIEQLESLKVSAVRRVGAPGVYVCERKIAALGLRVRRACTFHGLAFNLNMDLEPFERINPCGFEDLRVTQLADHHASVDWDEQADALAQRLALALNYGAVESVDEACTAGHS